jgi:hypothetical protein
MKARAESGGERTRGGPTRRSSEREPADSLGDKSNVIGGWFPSLTFAFGNNSMSFPSPTAEETAQLRVVIEDFDTRTALQAALALAVLRGYQTFGAVSDYLGVPVSDLEEANRSLWGILHDSSTGKLWIK